MQNKNLLKGILFSEIFFGVILPINSASFSDFRPGLRFSEFFSLSWLTNATVNTLISYTVKKKNNRWSCRFHLLQLKLSASFQLYKKKSLL